MEGVYGDNVNVFREIGFKGSFFRRFHRGLSGNNGADFCG